MRQRRSRRRLAQRPLRRRHPPRQGRGSGGADPEAFADALEVVVAALRAGLPPGDALHIMAESTEWGRVEQERVAHVCERVGQGAPTRPAWTEPGGEGKVSDAYRTVGGVWDLAGRTGAPLADALVQVADHLREQARMRDRLDALAAAPRTSQRLLTLLPLVGPVLAVLVGADPMALYASSPVAVGAAILGLVLNVVGWRWSRRLVAAAARPRPYRTGSAVASTPHR